MLSVRASTGTGVVRVPYRTASEYRVRKFSYRGIGTSVRATVLVRVLVAGLCTGGSVRASYFQLTFYTSSGSRVRHDLPLLGTTQAE